MIQGDSFTGSNFFLDVFVELQIISARVKSYDSSCAITYAFTIHCTVPQKFSFCIQIFYTTVTITARRAFLLKYYTRLLLYS